MAPTKNPEPEEKPSRPGRNFNPSPAPKSCCLHEHCLFSRLRPHFQFRRFITPLVVVSPVHETPSIWLSVPSSRNPPARMLVGPWHVRIRRASTATDQPRMTKQPSGNSPPKTARGQAVKPDQFKAHEKNSMANKYCDHYSTHSCTNQVPSSQSLCADCAAGLCTG